MRTDLPDDAARYRHAPLSPWRVIVCLTLAVISRWCWNAINWVAGYED